MTINFSKTKEIVFFRPNPYRSVHPLPVDDIEQLLEAKVLGSNFEWEISLRFSSPVYNTSVRLYSMKLLQKQGLAPKQMGIVFQAIILS